MAEIKKDKIFKENVEVLSITQYIEKYGSGVTIQAIDYAMKKDKLDYAIIGQDRFVVMTEKSRSYVPNKNINRSTETKETRTSKLSLKQ